MLATKNVATVLAGCALVLALSFAVATPAKADMLSDLQAQVQDLLAKIAALSGGSTSGSGCFAFTMTHQMGDTGGEVMQIQKFLNSHGAQVSASGAGSVGNESTYFGALTRAAVAKWQAANGVSPAAGYWGPLTRAKVASVCATTGTPGTPGTPSGTLNGTAGTANFVVTSEDVEDEVLTGQTEKVSAFRMEASGSDLRVTNVRVMFDKDDSTGTASDNLSAYFSEVSIWANGTKIGSMSASSFTRDSAGIYSASIPVDQIIRMGSGNRVTFHIGATGNTSVDSDDINGGQNSNDWNVSVTQVRYTDASGAVLFENPSTMNPVRGSNEDIYVTRLSQSGEVTLRLGEGSGNPKAGNVEVDESNSKEVTLLEFTLKAEGADMYFDQFVASTTATGADVDEIASAFYLMRGSTRIAEEDANTGTSQELSFSLDDLENISSGSTQTYRIVARVNAIGGNFDNTDSLTASTSRGVYNINARATSDGKSVTDRAGSVTGYTQTFFSEGIQVVKVGDGNVQITSLTTTGDSYGTYDMTVRVTAFGDDDVYVPLTVAAGTTTYQGGQTQGFVFGMNAGGSATTTGSGTVSRVSGNTPEACGASSCVRIAGGSSADFKLSVNFNPQVTGGPVSAYLQLFAVGHRSDATAAPIQTAVQTTPSVDFRVGEGSQAVPNN